MKQLNFREVAELINHSQTTQIELDPVMQEEDWDLYVGRYRIHAHEHEFRVLNLRSNVSNNGLRDAKSRAFKPRHTQVVYAPSIDDRMTAHRALFEGESSGFWNLREYLQSFFAKEHESYKNALAELAPSDYIEPQVKVPAGVNRMRPNPLHSLLIDRAPQGQQQPGTLGVLLAGPGQGKTYMTQYLVTAVMHMRQGFLPIYIRSDQWQTMSLEDMGSLWKTIGHSFRHFNTPIGWIEDHEDQFIRTSLKAGLFTIIFDGLDEYLLRNHDRVSASDVLSALVELVSDTGARIVVTSRTTLWNVEFASEVTQKEHTSQVAIYEIKPFDQNHARNYFRKKSIQVNNALQLFSRLRQHAPELIGRGFVLKLVADLFEGNQEESNEIPERRQPLLWLMEALCERDRRRQNLRLTASEQLEALKIFFSEVVQGEPRSSDTLSFSIELVASRLDADAVAECVRNMSSHALLQCVDSRLDEWEAPERQVQMALLADYVIDIALTKPDQGAISAFCQRGKLSKEQAGVLSETVIDLIFSQFGLDKLAVQIRKLVHNLSHGFANKGMAENRSSNIRRLLMLVVVSALDRLAPKGTDRVHRTEYFIDMLPNREIRGLHFFGTIARLDFSGCQFEDCLFEETKWANCKFDQKTRFVKCRIVGGSNEYCSDFGLAKWGKTYRR